MLSWMALGRRGREGRRRERCWLIASKTGWCKDPALAILGSDFIHIFEVRLLWPFYRLGN